MNKKLTTVLLDYDNTLIFYDEKAFTHEFMDLLYEKHFSKIFDLPTFRFHYSSALTAIFTHNSSKTNSIAFLDAFCRDTELTIEEVRQKFSLFYQEDLYLFRKHIDPNPGSKKLFNFIFENNINVIIATNPVFPDVANRERVKWAEIDGLLDYILEMTSSDYYTTTKPQKEYYLAILRKFKLQPEETIMIGNDPVLDIASKGADIKSILLEVPSFTNKKDSQRIEFPFKEFPTFLPDHTIKKIEEAIPILASYL